VVASRREEACDRRFELEHCRDGVPWWNVASRHGVLLHSPLTAGAGLIGGWLFPRDRRPAAYLDTWSNSRAVVEYSWE